MRKFLLLLITSSCMLHCTDRANTDRLPQQQVIAGELPDPSVIELNGVYYATGSSNDWGPVYPLYQSTDLLNWSFVNYIFNDPPAWTMSGYWAPELFEHNGTVYCYYTARNKKGVSCIGVATTQDIGKGFQDRGILIEWGNEAIDAFVVNDKGKLYITWKAYGLTPDKPIQIMGNELAPDGLSLKGKAFEVLTADRHSWENGGIEGQCIIKHNGYLYMLYSGNSCCGGTCNYQVGVARSRSMQGPWDKYGNNPLLKSNSTWKCPGHGTALNTRRAWYYMYHAYSQNGFPYLGRSALLSQLLWDEKSGWPYFNADTDSTTGTVLKRDVIDKFDSGPLHSRWRYDVTGCTFGTDIEEGKLMLTAQECKNMIGAAVAVNPDDADFTMSTIVSQRNDALKGVVLYATGVNAVGLGIKGDSLLLWKVHDGAFATLNRMWVDSSHDIFLKADVTDGHLAAFYFSSDGEGWQPVSNIAENKPTVTGDNLAWWSWGVKAGLFVRPDPVSGSSTGAFDEFAMTYR